MSESDYGPMPDGLEEEIDELMGDDAYYPVFKPGDWVGIQHGAVRQTMLGTKENPELVIGFGMDAKDHYVFLMGSDQDKVSLDKAVANAYRNIDAVDFEFSYTEALDNHGITGGGTAFSSELLLSPKHMQKAHELLNAKQFLVSIPKRTEFLAVPRDAPKEVLGKFNYFHKMSWLDESNGNAPITQYIFVVEDSKVVEVLTLQIGH